MSHFESWCRSETTMQRATGLVSKIYLGEDGGPDGLDLLNLGGANESLDLLGLEDKFDVSYC